MKTIRGAVERSMPDPDRPRLRAALERRFAPGEARSAAVYADLEAVCRRAEQLASEMDGVVTGEIECTPSLALELERAFHAARPPTDPPEDT